MKRITDNQLQQKRTSDGKRKIPIIRIADKTTRQVTFSKRRLGLFKKCSELCNLFPGTQFAAITFSVGGKPFSHGYPCFDTVINRFLNDNREGNCSRNVVSSDKKWWETSIDDMKLEELEEFMVALEGLQNGVILRVGELGRVHESENGFTGGFNPDPQVSNYCEQSTENFKVECYDFPEVIDCVDYVCSDARLSSKFSEYSHETTESFDLGPVVANVGTGTLFDVIKGFDFGCNDATVSPKFSDNCPELMDTVDFESVDAIPDAQVSDLSPEVTSIEIGNKDESFCPQICDNSRERTKSFDLTEVLKSGETECNDSLCPKPSDKSQDVTKSYDFESVDADLVVQVSDFFAELESIDFRSIDETFTPQLNSQERQKSFDLTEVLNSIDVECNDATLTAEPSDKTQHVTEGFEFGSVDASLGLITQASDYSSWMDESVVPEFFPKYLPADDKSLLSVIGCC